MLFFFLGFVEANFETVQNFSEIDITESNPEDLYIFDIDDVISRFKGVLGHNRDLKEKMETIEEELDRLDLSLYQLSIFFKKTDMELIDPTIIDFIKGLRSRGIRIIALTHFPSGKFGIIQSVEEWRFKMLESLGIVFTQTFNGIPTGSHVFKGKWTQRISYFGILFKKSGIFPSPIGPVFHRGILIANKVNKGETLGAFLETTGLKPSRVVFYDDQEKNLKSIEDFCKERNIPFKGYLFKGAEKSRLPWDRELVLAQLKHLKKFNEWKNDDEIRTMIPAA